MRIKQSVSLGKEYNVDYGRSYCGMLCEFGNMSEYKSDNEFKSNDNISNDINSDGQTYDLILFGSYYKRCKFVSSLLWLSLRISNHESYTILVDNDKTKQFQNTFVDKEIGFYGRFGYAKWKHYLILFGGRINSCETDSIFYFDFFEMKWYKSYKVL